MMKKLRHDWRLKLWKARAVGLDPNRAWKVLKKKWIGASTSMSFSGSLPNAV
jgi:hypothetical protein